jgi:hypothetical protein
VKQLYLALPGSDMHPALQSLYDSHHDSKTGKTTVPSEQGLIMTIGQIAKDFDHTYVLIDALDECLPIDRKSHLLPMIDALQSQTACLSLFVTSRREHDIQDTFGAHPQIAADQPFLTDDIGIYIKAEMEKKPRLRKLPDPKKGEIFQKLVEKADGM